MTSFAELQSTFQRGIVEPDDRVLTDLLDGDKEKRDILFNVYRHAYVSRLVEVMRNNHPLLHAYLGDDGFDEMARAYIAAHPSHHANLRWFCQKLPEFLRTAEPYDDHPVIAELAMIEVALENAFDAGDETVLALEGLAAIPPDSWGDVSFYPHVCAKRFDMATNAFAIWNALRGDEMPPAAEMLAERAHLIVWRQDTTAMIREMSNEEAMMWDEASRDVPFGTLCAMVATYDDPENAATRAAGHLHGWIVTGLLTRLSIETR